MWNLETKPLLVTLLNGRYQVLKVLSASQASQTYLAKDTHTTAHSQCIIQQFPFIGSVSSSWPAVEEKFVQMAKRLETLAAHAQIPQLLAYFEDHHSFYIVQEWIEGRSLRAELATGTPWTETQVIEFLQEITGILEFVHRHGMVHGNLNPDHLICRREDGKFVLTGFELETQIWQPVLEGDNSETANPSELNAGSTSNTESILIPPNRDLYQLGIIALQALTGMPVQFSDSPYCWELWQETLPISPQLLCILQQMLCPQIRSRDESDPHQHTAEVLQAISAITHCEPTSVLTPVVPPVIPQEMPEFEPSPQPSHSTETTSKYHEREIEPPLQPYPPEPEELSLLPPQTDTALEPVEPVVPIQGNEQPESVEASSENEPEMNAPKTSHLQRLSPALLLTLVGLAVGLTANVAAIIFAVYNLLFAPTIDPGLEMFVQARSEYQAGNIQNALALANSVASYSAAYREAKASIEQWQYNWEVASEQFQLMEEAFQQKRWHDVLEASRKVPEISAWHEKIEPMVEKAASQLDAEIQPLLKTASDRALQKDFAGAVKALKQIPSGIPNYDQIEAKITEYNQKQKIKDEYIAHQLLSKAYAKAANKDFAGALKYLKQIPKDTEAYTMVYSKRIEYNQKLREQTKGKVKPATNKGRLQTYQPASSRQKQASRFGGAEGAQTFANLDISASGPATSRRLNPGEMLHEVQPIGMVFVG
jgi:serine/threonine-protein kinase